MVYDCTITKQLILKSCAEVASFMICKKNCLLYASSDEDEKIKDRSIEKPLTRDKYENRQNNGSKVNRTYTH